MGKSEKEITLIMGDVCQEETDAIVVPQFSDNYALTGVSGAVLHSSHYRGILDYGVVSQQVKVPFGYALATDGSNGVKIINVSLLDADPSQMFSLVQQATFAALMEADKLGLETVSFPAMGTGESGCLNFHQSAQAVLSAMYAYLRYAEISSVENIKLCVYKSEKAFKVCRRIFKKGKFRSADCHKLWEDCVAVRRRMLVQKE